jgi:hypothetical protein
MINHSLEIIKLDEKVWVYKNCFKNIESTLEYFISNNNWSSWYVFGEKTDINLGFDGKIFNSFPLSLEWNKFVNENIDNGFILYNEIILEILSIFYNTTHQYVTANNIEALNWKLYNPTLCKYFSDSGSGENMAMSYHTDYQQEKKDSRGDNFLITCNMYLNDNYDDGEIMFKIFNENNIIKTINYKPSKGDVVVFPSTPPYYHGVNKTKNGEKYFIRSFWFQEFPGSLEWLENEKKYGKEVWAEMEKQRQHKEAMSGIYLRNDNE